MFRSIGAEVRFRCSQRRYHDHVSMYIYTPASSLCGCASTTQSFAPNGLPGSCPRPLPGYAVYPGVPTLYPADYTVPGLYPATGQGYAWVQRGTPRVPGHFRVKAGYNWVRTGNSPGNGGKIHSATKRRKLSLVIQGVPLPPILPLLCHATVIQVAKPGLPPLVCHS